jgi:HTH-like domain
MSMPDWKGLLDRDHGKLSIRGQCRLLGIARSGVYRPAPANDAGDLALMRRIDALFMAWPFLGSRRITAMLRAEGITVNRKRVRPGWPHRGLPRRHRVARATRRSAASKCQARRTWRDQGPSRGP